MSEPTIYAALASVMEDVRAVRKGDFNNHQNFSFRGIDSVVNAVGPVLRKHGVIVVPVVQTVAYEKVTTTGNKPSTACRVLVNYVFHGPAGDSLTATVVAEAWDSGDKAAPKAMSVAFRTALLQALALPTDEPDPDSQVYERGHDSEPSVAPDPLLAAKMAVRAAWQSGHDGGFDAEAMAGEYEQWAAAPLADASAEQLTEFATSLTPKVENEPSNLATAKQVQALSIAMSNAGYTDREQVLDWLEQVVRRRVDSRKELTVDEIRTALTAAKAMPVKDVASK